METPSDVDWVEVDKAKRSLPNAEGIDQEEGSPPAHALSEDSDEDHEEANARGGPANRRRKRNAHWQTIVDSDDDASDGNTHAIPSTSNACLPNQAPASPQAVPGPNAAADQAPASPPAVPVGTSQAPASPQAGNQQDASSPKQAAAASRAGKPGKRRRPEVDQADVIDAPRVRKESERMREAAQSGMTAAKKTAAVKAPSTKSVKPPTKKRKA